ncbi:MAG: glycerate kinase [Chloroflexi bacterium]|nr:glycerate kinase [Chloroflexota bacterium]
MSSSTPRALAVLFAPDSFKGSLTSVEVARALAAGWSRARPEDEILLAPLADGGEGTTVAIEAAGGWEWREADATDPIGRPIRARWLQSDNGARAIVELAAASGLSRLEAGELDPLGATTQGTGELVRAALDAGVRDITLGIGGSATNDGGAGILRALGATVSGAFAGDGVGRVDLAELDARLADTALRIACDVANPLLGAQGAAATYGPQKGARPDEVAELDRRLGRYADALEAASGRRERGTPGAGAAGGTGFGLLCLADRFASLELVPGIDVVMAAADFDAKLAKADVVITGEGRIDAQTAFGKTALGVARRAAAAGVPCIAVGGGVEPEGIEALRPLSAVVVPVVERPQTVEEAMAAGSEPLERCGERIARLVDLGRPPGASSTT